MSALNALQMKIGGPAHLVDREAIIVDAQRALEGLAPQIEAGLQGLRIRLRLAMRESEPDYAEAFSAAHQIRGLAGSVGRNSVGALGDILATYITRCRDAGSICSVDATQALACAVDRAFELEEGDAVLAAVLAAGVKLNAVTQPK